MESVQAETIKRRCDEICDLLASRRQVRVHELARHFRVSAVTIRRDLAWLEGQGKLRRTRGGAMPAAQIEFSFEEKIALAKPEKEAIGRAAASLAKPGDSIILDSGSTTYLAARFLRNIQGITIVTNSIPPILELRNAHGVEVIALGGVLNRTSAEFVGPSLRMGLDGLHATMAFLGADGLTVARGAQTATASAADSARLLAEHAEQRIVLADASKIGRDSFVTYLECQLITRVITAGKLDARAEEECRRLRDCGIDIVCADCLDTKGNGV
ncbi:MAG: DeoR/GlpR family DNA-binding transcription regulator [Planctomycetota bacterium]